MINFIFMLTHHDRTVPNAAEVLADLRGTGLALVGCKDVGATPDRLRDLVARAHDDGLEMMLEVVSTSREDELASVRAAVAAGFDWVLGGTHAADAAALLAGTGIRYCPFPGTIVGHPSVLLGEIDEIAHSAHELTSLDGVHGVDLLAYRHPTADVYTLTAAVVAASSGPGDRGRLGGRCRADQHPRRGRGLGLHHRRRDLRGPVARWPGHRRAGPHRARRRGRGLSTHRIGPAGQSPVEYLARLTTSGSGAWTTDVSLPS